LGYLIELLADLEIELPSDLPSSDWLTPWGVLFRYDDEPAISLDRDAATAAAVAAVGLAEQTISD
jgi:hypothetical protein